MPPSTVQNGNNVEFRYGHLNAVTIERLKGQKILRPDHLNGRILKDLQPGGYDITVLPDRQWVPLSDRVKVQCITTRIRDSSCWSIRAAACSSTPTMPVRATARAKSATSPRATNAPICWRCRVTATPT